MIDHIAIIGAGSCGKAAAVDLALQGKKVRLFVFPEFEENLRDLIESKTLISSGAVEGKATLELVTTDLQKVMDGIDTVMICTQPLTHDRSARELAPPNDFFTNPQTKRGKAFLSKILTH